MIADDVVRYARECIGTPFLHQGRIAGAGLDCAGVLAHILASLELPYIDEKGYSREPFRGLLLSNLVSQPHLSPTLSTNSNPGTVLLMRFTGEPQHIAICAGQTIIHGYFQSGKVVEHAFDFKWRRRVTHAFEVIA